jgi:hypothetical protein
MWLIRCMDEFSRDHRRFKRYCKAQVENANMQMDLADKRGDQAMARTHAEQYNFWKKHPKYWRGMRGEDHVDDEG